MNAETDPRSATLAALLALSDHQARQWVDRSAPADPGDLAMMALAARGLAATLEAVAEHASAAALVALDDAETED